MTHKPVIYSISDTHNRHKQLVIPPCDILIHVGDATNRGNHNEIQPFLNWLQEQDAKYKIYIPGNHDFVASWQQSLVKQMCKDRGIIFLVDDGVTLMGVNIWGSPYTPTFGDWAFMRDRGAEIRDHWNLIPTGLHILATHGPPYGILDQTMLGAAVGCYDLLQRVMEVKPKVHLFGHIHENNGMKEILGVKFYNVAICDDYNRVIEKPTLVEL